MILTTAIVGLCSRYLTKPWTADLDSGTQTTVIYPLEW